MKHMKKVNTTRTIVQLAIFRSLQDLKKLFSLIPPRMRVRAHTRAHNSLTTSRQELFTPGPFSSYGSLIESHPMKLGREFI